MGPGFESLKAHQTFLLHAVPFCRWPVGQVVKTAASHAANRSSTLLRVTKKELQKEKKYDIVYSGERSCTLIVGIYDDEGPPVPIPNTEVKLIGAENT